MASDLRDITRDRTITRGVCDVTSSYREVTSSHTRVAWTARAIITRLRQAGWRPTQAQPAPGWQHRDVTPAEPTAEYLAARPRSTT